MDISNFMTWFINQVVSIFTWMFNILNSIEFWGTSLLKLIVTITIISAMIPVLLTIGQTGASITEYNVKVKEKNKKEREKAN